MKFKNNSGFIIGVTLLLVAMVLVWQLLLSLKSHQLLTNADYARKAGEPIPVSTVMAQRGSLDSVMAGECVARASAQVELSTDISGRVVSLAAKVGDSVVKDQLLIKLDDTVLKAIFDNTREAELTLKTLKSELKPFVADLRVLRDKTLVPVKDLIDAIEMQRRAEVDVIRVQKERIQATAGMKSATIVSPLSGVLTSLDVSPGTVLRAYESAATISQLDPIWVECEFAADRLAQIKNFDHADASFTAYPGNTFAVKLEKILPVTTKDTHAVIVQFALANKSRQLLPGMQAVVRLGKRVEGIKIPAISLINSDGVSASVFIIDRNKKARFIPLGIGRYAQGYVEVRSGLDSGQRVVVAGQNSLQDGDTVREEMLESMAEGLTKTLFPAKSR